MIMQATYAAKMLEQASMENCHAVHALLEAWLKLNGESPEKTMNATFYGNIIGCLRYLVHSRLDIAFVVGIA